MRCILLVFRSITKDFFAMEDYNIVCTTLVQCARLIAKGKIEDARIYLTRIARGNAKKSDSSVWGLIRDILNEFPCETNATRDFNRYYQASTMLDESPLVQYEKAPVHIDIDPIWTTELSFCLNQIILEWNKKKELKRAGLAASKAVLFSGPPGTGKTLAAKWIAKELNLPVFTLNLASVMSSLLGKTGNNIQCVFERTKNVPCILLLDEFDSIAKKRDDLTEIGELKRLVTVLLQEIDNWSDNSLLIAATNHQDLLDSAVWRRFDVVLNFGNPSSEIIERVIRLYLGSINSESEKLIPALTILFQNDSYSGIQKSLLQIRKKALLNNSSLSDEILNFVAEIMKDRKKNDNINLAIQLVHAGVSQRQACIITGVSRDTIRKKGGK